MKLNKISIFFFKRYIKALKVLQKRIKKFRNYSDIRSVLILYKSDVNEVNPLIQSITKSLHADGKKVTLCGFVNTKHTVSAASENAFMFDKSSVNFLQKPNATSIAPLLENTYDAVLDLTLEVLLPLQYVLAEVSSSFKAGCKNSTFGLLDFMIDLSKSSFATHSDEKTGYLFEQIIFYLKSVKSNN